MAKRILTDTKIKQATATGTVYRLREVSDDPDLAGLHVVISAKGGKSFSLAYTSPETGARRFWTLGSYPTMKLAQARREARAVREQINQGIDPAAAAARLKEAHRAALEDHEQSGSVTDVCDLYVAQLRADGKRSADEVARVFAKEITPAIGEIKARDVTTEQLAAVIAPIARRAPVLGDRTRAYLIAAFNLAVTAAKDPRLADKALAFGLVTNPAADIKRVHQGREKPGTRALTPDEIRQVWTGFDPDPYTTAAVRLLIATGQRVEEVLHAQWREFDLAARVWTIPAARRKQRHKVYTDHVVPLGAIAVKVLKAIPQFRGCPWLFPAAGMKTPRNSTSISQATRRWCDANAFERFTPRDLRRTWKQRAGRDVRLDLEIRNRIQGHAFSDIGSVSYDGLDDSHAYLDDKTAAMAKWDRWLGKVITGKTAKVVSIKSGGAA